MRCLLRFMRPVIRQLQFLSPLFWMVSSWPGYMNSDAYLVFVEAKKNNFSNWHPVAFGFLMKLSILFTSSPAPLLIAQLFLVILSLKFLLRSMKFGPDIRALITFIFFFLPTVGVFVATLGKDVFFMCALFAVTGAVLNIKANFHFNWNLFIVSFGIFCLCVFRWNGPLVGLTALMIFAFEVRRTTLKLSAPILAYGAGCLFLLLAPFSDNQGGKDIMDVGKHLDIAWLLKKDPLVFSSDEIKVLNYVAPIQKWSGSQANCDNSVMPLIWAVFTVDPTAAAHLTEKREAVASIWSKHLKADTWEIIKGRMCRSRAILAFHSVYPPLKAETSNDVLKKWYFVDVPALSPSIQSFGTNISEWWRFLPHISLFGQPALPAFLLGVRLVLSRMNRKILIPTLLSATGVVSIAVGGTGVEPRYLYPAVFLMWITILSPKDSINKKNPMDSSLVSRTPFVSPPVMRLTHCFRPAIWWRTRPESDRQAHCVAGNGCSCCGVLQA